MAYTLIGQLCSDLSFYLLQLRAIQCSNFADVLDRTNLAPLHTATNNDNVAVVSALVAAGANPNLHGIGGATPLHIGVGIYRISHSIDDFETPEP